MKLKALVKKVLPKKIAGGGHQSGEKRDYDTDSSSQDHLPLLPDYNGSTDGEESSNGGDSGENFAQFKAPSPRPIPDDGLPIATPIVESHTPSTKRPKSRQVQSARYDHLEPQAPKVKPKLQPMARTKAFIKVNVNSHCNGPAFYAGVNSHRSRAFYEAAAAAEETSKGEEPSKFPMVTCHVPEFPSDVSGVSDEAVLPPSDPLADAKLVSKAAFLKALQASGAMLETGNKLCVATYEKSLKEIDTVPCINKAPASIEGAMLEIVSTTTQSTVRSVSSILEAQEDEEDDFPDDEGTVVKTKSTQKNASDAKTKTRRNRRMKERTRRREEVTDPDTVADGETTVQVCDNDDDNFFLMTVEDVEAITKMAREFTSENSADGEGGLFDCYLVKDVVEWLLCTSIQGGGRHAMTKKQAKTWFADQDMTDDQSSMGLAIHIPDTKFVDEDMPAPPKRSIHDGLKSSSQEFDQSDNSVVHENEDDDSDSDSDPDDGDDFYFDDPTITSASKVVRQFRPTGMICTDDLAIVYGCNLEQLEGTIETVLVVDDKKYAEKTDKQMEMEQVHCEYGADLPVYEPSCPANETEDEVCAHGPIPNFDESKFTYDYQNYQIRASSSTEKGPMDIDAIVCARVEDDDKCWDTLSNITPVSATSQHGALHRRLQQLETELTRLQLEYIGISGSNEEQELMEEFQNEPTDDSSIDGQLKTKDNAPQSGGDNESVRSDVLEARLSVLKMLREEKAILERRVQELVSMMEASALCHSKQLAATKTASNAKLEELQFQQKKAIDEAAKKIRELEFSLLSSQSTMADIRAKYSQDLEVAKLSHTKGWQEIHNQQQTALDAAISKIEELESSLKNSQEKLEQLKEKYSRDLAAAEREHMFKARKRDLIESDLRARLDDIDYKAAKDREESQRMVREIREEHAKQIEEMIQQLDVVVAQHEKEHAKEFEKLIAQLDLVVAEHEEKTKELDRLVQQKDDLIANLGSQLAKAQSRLNGSY